MKLSHLQGAISATEPPQGRWKRLVTKRKQSAQIHVFKASSIFPDFNGTFDINIIQFSSKRAPVEFDYCKDLWYIHM